MKVYKNLQDCLRVVTAVDRLPPRAAVNHTPPCAVERRPPRAAATLQSIPRASGSPGSFAAAYESILMGSLRTMAKGIRLLLTQDIMHFNIEFFENVCSAQRTRLCLARPNQGFRRVWCGCSGLPGI
jgi:hypothetical protein